MLPRTIKKSDQGIIQFLIIIVLSLVILSLLGVSLSSLFNNHTLRENFMFMWHWIVHVWNTYVGQYAHKLFEIIRSKI